MLVHAGVLDRGDGISKSPLLLFRFPGLVLDTTPRTTRTAFPFLGYVGSNGVPISQASIVSPILLAVTVYL